MSALKGIMSVGKHAIIEYYGCDPEILNDSPALEQILTTAAIQAGSTPISALTHRFTPLGVSVVILLKESHITIHTWPELQYAAVDLFTCGNAQPELAHRYLVSELAAKDSKFQVLSRGYYHAYSIS